MVTFKSSYHGPSVSTIQVDSKCNRVVFKEQLFADGLPRFDVQPQVLFAENEEAVTAHASSQLRYREVLKRAIHGV